MTSFVINGLSQTARTLADGETGVVAEGSELITSGVDAVTGAGGNEITVLGNITTLGVNDTVDFDGTTLDLFVGAAGSVMSTSNRAMNLRASDSIEVFNAGTIFADGTAVRLDNSDGSAYLNVINNGTISGAGAILLDSGTSAADINNAGILQSNSTTIFGAGGGGITTIVNAGTISTTSSAAMLLGSGNDIVINKGLIVGGVSLGTGNDTFDGREGTIADNVSGNGGDDTYIIDDSDILLVESGGQGTDTVQSAADAFALGEHFENLTLIGAGNIDGTGNDTQNTITGNAGANVINGLGSRDTINAGGGNDTVDAGRGNDTVEGGDGDDSIVGRAGNDILNGGEGSDFIFGGLGNDVIDGGNGDDRLKGGLGADTLTGGSGADTFLFCRTDESPTAAFDRVTDFDAGLDVLDLSGMTDAPLTFSSAGAIGGGTASVFLSVTGGGNTNVFVDVDGDGTADARVLLQGSTGVTEADFIF